MTGLELGISLGTASFYNSVSKNVLVRNFYVLDFILPHGRPSDLKYKRILVDYKCDH